jgi:hypothetical protein
MPDLNDLNARAQKKFADLKNQKGWTRERIEELKQKGGMLREENLEKILNPPDVRVNIEDKVYHIEERRDSAKVKFEDYLDALQLPANLSMALAQIIYAKSTTKDKKAALTEAIQYIQKEIENG